MTNLKMPIMMLENNTQALELELSNGEIHKIVCVGPSFNGMVYRSVDKPAYFRLLPTAKVPLDIRTEVRKYPDPGRPRKQAVAPIVSADHAFIKGTGQDYFYIQYESQGTQTWQDLLANPDLAVRLDSAHRTLKNYLIWKELLNGDPGKCLLFMPADIIFEENQPFLLFTPMLSPIDLDVIWEQPYRALFLAPEYICGQQKNIFGENLDLYAMGMMCLQTVYTVQEIESVARLLTQIACGSLFASESVLRNRLPFWLEKIAPCQQMIAMLHQMADHDPRKRSAVDVVLVANKLDEYRIQLAPEKIISTMRDQGKAEEAFVLLQDILLTRPSYELLLLGGKMAWEDLQRPLEAIDLLENAINEQRGIPDAYDAQFDVIASSVGLHKEQLLGQLDNRIQRDFLALTVNRQLELERDLARYYMARGKNLDAAHFIYPRIMQGDKFIWWKFPLVLDYIEALICLKERENAAQMIALMKEKLRLVRENQSVPIDEIHAHGSRLSDLETFLLTVK